jgi:rhodanese-related sulfurtransferase
MLQFRDPDQKFWSKAVANFGAISADKLSKLVGTPQSPTIIDVRDDGDFAAYPSLIPASVRRDFASVEEWAGGYSGTSVVVACKRGKKLSEGVAAVLRLASANAEILEGGSEAWLAAGLPMVPVEKIPDRSTVGKTLWVTRARPKIDRIACPWLIRRFVDPAARFLFVSAAEVPAVAEKFGATPFDIDGVFWSHRGETCTFDTMIEEFRLDLPALKRLADIVRGADTDRPDLAPSPPACLRCRLVCRACTHPISRNSRTAF